MKKLLCSSIAVLLGAAMTLAHSGGLDSRGGHMNRKTGQYHYHRQPAAPAVIQADAPAAGTNQVQSVERTHWITTSSGIRHGKSCRYFNASKGRFCGADEGRACKICGG